MNSVLSGGRCKRAVIRFGARPTTGGFVATLAGRGGRNVTAVLAARNRAVMAADAAAQHLRMIEMHVRAERVGVMAGCTIICGWDMRRRLRRCVELRTGDVTGAAVPRRALEHRV